MAERFYFGNKFFDAAEGAPTNGRLRDDVEPDFHLVEPGRVGGREVHVVTGACCQPALDARMLVGSIVIDNQVHVKGLGPTCVDMPQKIEELLMTMTAFALTQVRSGDRVEGRKQCGGAVSDVVVRDAFDIAESQWQHRLATLQRLNLALLVHAQDQGLIRWVQIQPDYVPYLLDEEGVVGKLEVTRSVRLQAEGAPDPVDGRFREASFCRQRATTPMRAVFRFSSQGSADQRGDLFIGDRTWAAGAHLLVQSCQPLFHETSSPEADCHLVQSPPTSDVLIGQAVGAEQNDSHTGHQAMGQRARASHRFQWFALFPLQLQRGQGSS